MTLNKKQDNELAVLRALDQWFKSQAYSPTFRDLALITGISLSTVHETCVSLRENGDIDFADGVARTLRLKDDL